MKKRLLWLGGALFGLSLYLGGSYLVKGSLEQKVSQAEKSCSQDDISFPEREVLKQIAGYSNLTLEEFLKDTRVKAKAEHGHLAVLEIENYNVPQFNAENLPYLRRLGIKNSGLEQVHGLESCPNLVYLALYCNKLKEVPGLESLKILGTLLITGNQIEELDISSNKFIRTLNASGNRLTEIKGLEDLQFLRSLYLTSNPMNSLPDLSNATALEIIDVRKTGVQEKDLGKLYERGVKIFSDIPYQKVQSTEDKIF